MNELDLGQWFILRTSSADTIRALDALRTFDVWTPIERKLCRTPRKRTQFDRTTPLMPGYLFAPTIYLDELLDLSRTATRGLPRFCVFTHKGGVPLVASQALEPLRDEEKRTAGIFARLKRKGRKAPCLAKGSHVTLTEGPFTGMAGIVQGQDGQYTLVSYEEFRSPIKIASVLLLDSTAVQIAA